jgi:hypothetical protein
MTLFLLKVHLQTFLSIPKTQKCHILSCDTPVANERYIVFLPLQLPYSDQCRSQTLSKIGHRVQFACMLSPAIQAHLNSGILFAMRCHAEVSE